MSKARLNYEQRGKGPTVVLIHGLFGDADNLNSLARSLPDDYATLRVDLRNHGESFHADTMSYAEMAEDVIDLLDHLNIKKAFFVGHSMGGKVAMQIALTHEDRVHAAIFADIAPVAYDPRHTEILEALEKVDLSQVQNRSDADKQLADTIPVRGVRQFLLKNLRRQDEGYAWRLNLPAIHANYDEITGFNASGNYQGPVLFIKGSESNYLLAAHQAQVEARFPNAQIKVIDGAGHWLHAEKPRIFNRLVERFLVANTRS